jgi:hypothetical protein
VTYNPGVRHLTRGKRLPSGDMADETWCGSVPLVQPAIRVADVECVPCLDAVIEAGAQARRRKIRLARDADR